MIDIERIKNLKERESQLDARGVKNVLFEGVAKEGPQIWVDTPANIKSVIDPVVPYAPLEFLEIMKESVLKSMHYYRMKYGENSNDFDSLRRKLNREIEERKTHMGKTYMPSEVVKNTYYSDKLVRSWEKEGIINAGSKIELVENYKNILALRESGYIQDAINSYVQEYYETDGATPNMKLTEDGLYFVITDTFDEFCKRGEISKDVKNDVKEALFPSQPGKKGLLESVPFIVPKDGKKKLMEVRYISARAVIKDPTPDKRIENLKRGDSEYMQSENASRIELFNIDVHAGLFDFLRHTEMLKEWKSASLTTGFIPDYPKNLSAKIDRQLKLIGTFNNPAYGTIPDSNSKKHQQLYAGTRIKADHEKYRKGISLCVHNWHTGSSRQTDMVITWDDLHINCGFPAHTKRKHERRIEMEELRKMLNAMVKFNEAFEGCGGVELTKAPLALVFTLLKPKKTD